MLESVLCVERCTMSCFACDDWGEKLQSSVIVPRNEIDSHPAEHEIALADDTAVTQPKTHCDSNVNNLQRSLTHNLWTEQNA